MAITNKEVTNKVDLIAPRHSANANGCNWIGLNEGVDTGQSVPYDVPHTLGSEEVDNGTFATDTIWGYDAGWTISAGEAHVNSTGTTNLSIYQANTLSSGTTVEITYEITSYTSGSVKWALSGHSTTGIERSAVGVYTEIITLDGNITYFALQRLSDAVTVTQLSVDNFSIKQITNANSYLTTLPKAGGSHVTYDLSGV